MKKWSVNIPIYASANYNDIVAETEEEAIEKAYQKGIPTLCHHCSHEIEVGEYADGIPPVAYVDEINQLLTMGASKDLKTRPHSKTQISVVYQFSNEHAKSPLV